MKPFLVGVEKRLLEGQELQEVAQDGGCEHVLEEIIRHLWGEDGLPPGYV